MQPLNAACWELAVAAVNPPESSSRGGIHLGDVGGNVEFSALGDIVGGDKIVNITTTIQISAEVVATRPLIVASPYRGLDRFEDRDKALFFAFSVGINSSRASSPNSVRPRPSLS